MIPRSPPICLHTRSGQAKPRPSIRVALCLSMRRGDVVIVVGNGSICTNRWNFSHCSRVSPKIRTLILLLLMLLQCSFFWVSNSSNGCGGDGGGRIEKQETRTKANVDFKRSQTATDDDVDDGGKQFPITFNAFNINSMHLRDCKTIGLYVKLVYFCWSFR